MPNAKTKIIGGLLALALAACSAGSSPPAAVPSALPVGVPSPAPTGAPADEVATISFGAQSYARPAYEPLIAEFNRQNPGIRVQFVSLDAAYSIQGAFDPDQQMRRLVSAADTLELYGIRPEDARQGVVYNMLPLLEADPGFDRDDFYPGALEQYAFDGGQYMLPRSLYARTVAYNKQLWERAGLAAPAPGWTQGDMLAAAERLAVRRGDEIAVYGLVDWGATLSALTHELRAAGIDLAATPAADLRYDRPELAKALGRVAELAHSGAIYHQPSGPNAVINSEEFERMVAEGRAAIWLRDFVGPIETRLSFEVGVLPYPGGGLRGGEGYVISGGARYPQAAWRWLAFLSAQPATAPDTALIPGNTLPARRSVAEQSGFWRALDAPTRAAAEALLARPSPPEPTLDYRLIEPLTQAIDAVVGDAQPPAQALRAAQARLEQARAEIALTPPPAANPAPIVVATPPPEPAAAAEAARITFGVLPGFGGSDAARRLAEQFNQQHPELFVEVKEIVWRDQMPTLAALAGQYDCFSWWAPPQLHEITATLDLQPLIDADASFDLADYPPAVLAAYRHGGGLYGLPEAVTLRVLGYNRTLFDAAGLAYPSAGWTIDDLVAAAQQLTRGSGANKQYGFVSLGNDTSDALYFLSYAGVQLVGEAGGRATPRYTDPQVAAALRGYLDLLRQSSPDPVLRSHRRGGWSSAGEAVLRAGRAALWFDFGMGASGALAGDPAAGFVAAIAPMPLGQAGLTPDDFQTRGLHIAAQSQQPAACWAWLKALASQPSNTLNEFPARSSLAESRVFLDTAPAGAEAIYAAYRPALARPLARDTALFASDIDLFWFFLAIERALGGKDLARELAAAQATTEQYLACVRGGGAPGACAYQADPQYDGWGR